jgi:leucyl-tRNA synthetase
LCGYLRYTSPDAPTIIDQRTDYWMPMDQYIGGIEHAILHLLYARFWTKVMRDMGLVHIDEPFTRLFTQGMLLNHIFFKRDDNGIIDYVPPAEVTAVTDALGHIVGGSLADGTSVEYGGIGKMGKSERNGVEPQDLVDRFGADTARLYVMFVGKPEDAALWSDTGVEGANRFLKRLWFYAQGRRDALARAPAAIDWPRASPELRTARRELHLQLKQADFDYQRLQYNTVVSAGMKMLNTLEAAPADASNGSTELAREGLSLLLRVLNPVVPHITHALWEQLGYAAALSDIIDAPWPKVDVTALVQDQIELVLQVNGKLRGKLTVAANADHAAIEAAAMASAPVQKAMAENGGDRSEYAPARIIVVPNRLVNVVLPARTVQA